MANELSPYYHARIELSRDGACRLTEEGHVNSIYDPQWNRYREAVVKFAEKTLHEERDTVVSLALEIKLTDITP